MLNWKIKMIIATKMSLTSGRDLTSPVTLQQRSHPLPIHLGVPRGHKVSAGQMTELDQSRDSYIILTPSQSFSALSSINITDHKLMWQQVKRWWETKTMMTYALTLFSDVGIFDRQPESQWATEIPLTINQTSPIPAQRTSSSAALSTHCNHKKSHKLMSWTNQSQHTFEFNTVINGLLSTMLND